MPLCRFSGLQLQKPKREKRPSSEEAEAVGSPRSSVPPIPEHAALFGSSDDSVEDDSGLRETAGLEKRELENQSGDWGDFEDAETPTVERKSKMRQREVSELSPGGAGRRESAKGRFGRDSSLQDSGSDPDTPRLERSRFHPESDRKETRESGKKQKRSHVLHKRSMKFLRSLAERRRSAPSTSPSAETTSDEHLNGLVHEDEFSSQDYVAENEVVRFHRTNFGSMPDLIDQREISERLLEASLADSSDKSKIKRLTSDSEPCLLENSPVAARIQVAFDPKRISPDGSSVTDTDKPVFSTEDRLRAASEKRTMRSGKPIVDPLLNPPLPSDAPPVPKITVKASSSPPGPGNAPGGDGATTAESSIETGDSSSVEGKLY